jgi:hypothetical protein
MKRIFTYDLNLYRKKLSTRLIVVLVSYILFLFWNYTQLSQEYKLDFLKIFIPLSVFLGFFLFRNFQKQLKLLSQAAFMIQGKKIKQFDGKQEILELDLNALKKILVGEYKSFPRIILEWEDRAMSIINLSDHMEFVILLEQISKIKHEINPNTGKYLTLKTWIYLAPSIIYAIVLAFLFKKNVPFVNPKTFFLFLNINLLIYFLYGVEQKEESQTGIYQTRRKIIFVLLAIFFYQVFVEFSFSLGMF